MWFWQRTFVGMKSLLLLFLLACGLRAAGQVSPTSVRMREIVTAHLKKTIANTSSYQPISWSEAKPETQQNEDIDKASDEVQAFVDGVKAGTKSDKHVGVMQVARASNKVLLKLNH